MSQPPGSPPPDPAPERDGTVIETDEEVRQALLAGLQRSAPFRPPAPPSPSSALPPSRVPARPKAVPTAPRVASRGVARPFRPTVRAPVALLTVYDDGRTEGEIIRIRAPRFVIGRTEGDLRIPLDGRISSRHAEIALQDVGGERRWVITDLQSTHGLFLRVTRTALGDQSEFLVGNGRYRLDDPQPDPASTVDALGAAVDTGSTRGWTDLDPASRPTALTELVGREIGNRVVLARPEYWIGSDPSCAIPRADDPFCEPRHARLYRSPKGGWKVENNKTRNGIWLRMAQITVKAAIQFQVGEQQFRFQSE